MRIEVSIKLDLKVKEVTKEVIDASRLGLRDTIVSIAGDAIQGSPVRTGNNGRSIAAEVAGMGKVSGEGTQERVVNENELEGAVYSTSGYGGYLEVGTGIYAGHGEITPVKGKFLVWETPSGETVFAKSVRGIKAQPYFRPALDKNKDSLIPNIKRYLK